MFRSLVKSAIKAVEAYTFTASKGKGRHHFPINTNQGFIQEGYVTKDAERIFEQFFKENPPK